MVVNMSFKTKSVMILTWCRSQRKYVLFSLLTHQVMSDQVCLSYSEREVCQCGLHHIDEDQVIQQ